MFFSWDDLVLWLGMTLFEMWIHVSSVVIFLSLVVLKLEHFLLEPWWFIFAPLFISDALNTYFCMIIFIRLYLKGMYKHALVRTVWSISLLLLLFVFKFLLCKKLTGQINLDFSEVFSPIVILLQLIAARTCRLC